MKTCLVDVNLLVAFAWPEHEFHETAQRWLGKAKSRGWATCPMVEAGFVRILSNPAFSNWVVTPGEAIEALQESFKMPGHQFWSDDITVAEALMPFRSRSIGHRQVTDLYLLSIAMHHNASLATLDRHLVAPFPPDHPIRNSLEILE
ncbi:MAG: TA system VapC family ribonuclease toxin [Candidatus Sulfotelmatobacter sp.]